MIIFSPIRHFFWTIAMIHKTAYVLAYDMLRKKEVRNWIERRANGIILLPYLTLILVALLTLKEEPNTGRKIVTSILIGWAFIATWCTSGFMFKPCRWITEIRKELDKHPRYWKNAIAMYYAAVVTVAITAAIVMLYL